MASETLIERLEEMHRVAADAAAFWSAKAERESGARLAPAPSSPQFAAQRSLEAVTLSEAIAALRASLSREEREQAWRPIATAPRDGTPVSLKWDKTTVEAVGRWAGGNLLYATTDWRDVKGNNLLLEPTHWKPSPPEIPR